MATAAPVDGPRHDGLVVRELKPAEASLHCDVAGPGFVAPPDLLAGLITPVVLGLPEVRAYVGEVDGEPVVTAMSVTLEDGVGIFNVATPPGVPTTGLRSSRDGACAARRTRCWGLLGLAAIHRAGYRVHETLGVPTLERWHCWVTPS